MDLCRGRARMRHNQRVPRQMRTDPNQGFAYRAAVDREVKPAFPRPLPIIVKPTHALLGEKFGPGTRIQVMVPANMPAESFYDWVKTRLLCRFWPGHTDPVLAIELIGAPPSSMWKPKPPPRGGGF